MAKPKKGPFDHPQAQHKHPEPWDHQLNPHHMEGQNVGQVGTADPEVLSVGDHKDLVRKLNGFTMDELRQIPLMRPGARLQQGKTYLDMAVHKVFTATGDHVVDEGDVFIPKSGTPYAYWNRLLGMTDPKRTI